jgi:DNA mismatch repair protein MutS2
VAETLVATARLADALREVDRPLLHGLYRDLDALPGLRSRLEASVDPAGEVLDTASPALGGLRRTVRIAHERLRTRLETLIRSEVAGDLQEPLVTMRAGRYVVPVRAEAQSRVKGIVHDRSASGQTLFVEPLIAIELSNAWREAQLAAQAEEERVLDELSGHVGVAAEALSRDLDALARFDLWMCRARLAEEMRAVRAETTTAPRVSLRAARHPGLSGTVVPVDVELGGAYTALVITGPNTGGKTVALRTVGLLALMHQSGLHVPAGEGSTLPVFRDVLADIGDEQSVAQSLSTFSGHLRTITRIVDAAGEGSLVLLDELGAGTDPTEGSALAQALLDHFIRAGVLVVATTHYAELKT